MRGPPDFGRADWNEQARAVYWSTMIRLAAAETLNWLKKGGGYYFYAHRPKRLTYRGDQHHD